MSIRTISFSVRCTCLCYRDVKDRGILKIHEPMPALSNDGPCSSPNVDIRLKTLQQGYESDSSACSAPPGVGMNSPRYRGPNKMVARSEVRLMTLTVNKTLQLFILATLFLNILHSLSFDVWPCTVESVLGDRPFCPAKVVSQDRSYKNHVLPLCPTFLPTQPGP